jgi:transposase
MTKFLVERRFHVGADEMPEVSRQSKKIIIDHFPEITWEHSHVVVDDAGTVKTYCVYEAPSEEIVRSHGDRLGLHDIEGVYEIAGDVTPDDFPLT